MITDHEMSGAEEERGKGHRHRQEGPCPDAVDLTAIVALRDVADRESLD